MKKKNSTHSQSKIRRKQIINAALKCFSELGFTETNMSDICRRAKASTGSIYHHFKSKEQLAAAVYIEGIKNYQNSFIENIEKEKDAFDGVTAIVRYHLKWIETHKEWSQFLFYKRHAEFMQGADSDFSELNKIFEISISKWIMNHIKTGKIKKLPRDLYIPLLLGPCQEYSKMYLSGKTITEIDDIIPKLANSIWLSISAKT